MEPRQEDTDDEIAEALYLGYVVAKDAKGKYSGTGHKGEPFTEAITAQPYGIRSYAPVNTGLVLTRSQAGLLVLSQHGQLPSGVSEPLSGEVKLYNSQGAQIHLDTNGDISITQKSGRFVNIGSAPEFAALASKVNTELDRIQEKYDTHTHPTAPSGPVSPPSNLLTAMVDVDAAEVKIT
jgi:hypothetical protein